jgi:hypothetical protein
VQDGITRRTSTEAGQNPSYRLRIWHHIEPVFVMAHEQNYDVRTPDMAAGHDLVLTVGPTKNKKKEVLKC